MRKRISLMIMLMLLLIPAATIVRAAELLPFTCEEQGYTTMVDPSWRTEWVDGDGVYYHFDSEYNMPYVLAYVYSEEGRPNDGDAFFDEELPRLQEKYSQNGGVSTTKYGSFFVGGRPVSAADIQYRNSQGLKIYLLIVLDVQDDYTAIYHARYLEESGRQDILDALDIIGSNLSLVNGGRPGGSENTEDNRNEPSSEVMSFTITDVVKDENAIGRCAAPAGYTTAYQTYICTYSQSAMNPCMAYITSYREDGPEMYYWSARDYMSGVGEEASTQDGQFNTDFQTPMLHYMTATEYCDYLAGYFFSQLEAEDIRIEETDTFPELQDYFDRQAQQHAKEADLISMGGLLKLDQDVITLARRVYSFKTDGTDYLCSVYTGNEAVYYTLHGYTEARWVNWGVPFTYVMFCPAKDRAEGNAAFDLFVSNTTTSDQFNRANKNMSDALWAGIRKAHDVTDCVNIASGALDREASTGDDYDDERFTDYIFDQNDYTLSDGSHVKVSTAYDYVYEGDNGVVYYSDSAFAGPGGGTQLYPN